MHVVQSNKWRQAGYRLQLAVSLEANGKSRAVPPMHSLYFAGTGSHSLTRLEPLSSSSTSSSYLCGVVGDDESPCAQ